MGVLEDIKDTFEGSSSSESSGDSTFGQTGSGDIGDNDFGSEDSIGSSEGLQSGDQNLDEGIGKQQGEESGLGQNPQGRQSGFSSQKQAGNEPRKQSQRDAGRESSQSSAGTPNAQAGRPKDGGSSPQLSQQTRRKMENAGISDGAQQERGRNPQSSNGASEQEVQELKRQNEQIIELLEDIVNELRGPEGRRR